MGRAVPRRYGSDRFPGSQTPTLRLSDWPPKGHRIYELADGTELGLDITTADIEFMGEIVGGTIIFGDPDVEGLCWE